MTASVIDMKNKKSPYQLPLSLIEDETNNREKDLMKKLGFSEEEVDFGWS